MYANDGASPRFDIKVPVRIRGLDAFGSVEHKAQTSNLSAGGIYFSSDIQLELGTPVRAYLRMPAQIFGKPIVTWCCDGRVVQLNLIDQLGKRLGVGISFYAYACLSFRKGRRTGD
jgi:hypothetical protein